MNIGINGRYLVPNKNGVARYLISILSAWARLDTPHRFFVFTHVAPPDEDQGILEQSSSFTIRNAHEGSFVFWYNWVLPRALRRDRIDFFFSPDYFLPPLPASLPRSLTIHDVSYLAHPEWFPRLYRLYCLLYSKRPAKKADCILTVSEFSRREILRTLSVDPQRVIVTPEAADPKFKPGSPNLREFRPLNVTEPYFLYVGKFLNRRHVRELMAAFAAFSVQSNQPMQLVLRGDNETVPHQPLEREAETFNRRLGRTAVVQLPYIDDATLIRLYQGAQAFFYLSDYEGFGLPVLEALSCGTLTVTTQGTALPEVGSDAVLYVEPTDHASLIETMRRIAENDASVQIIKARSVRRAAAFSWQRTAEQTLQALEWGYGHQTTR